MSNDLPQGWSITTLDEVAESISYGYTAKATSTAKGPRYLRITDIQNNSVDWASVPSCSIAAKRVPAYQLRRGDLVFARTGATTGKSFLINSCPEAVFASYLIRVRPATSLVPEFIARFFQSASYWSQISENISGSAQPNCNATKLSSLIVPIPPLSEQQRIVVKLEKLLGQVNNCQQRLAKVSVLLKRIRQSVLTAACSGRLTGDWREENPADGTHRGIIETVRRRRETLAKTTAQREKLEEIYSYEEENDSEILPLSWGFVALAKLCESFDYGTSTKSEPAGRVPVLRMGNIQNGKLNWEDLVYTSDEAEIEGYRLRPKTVLFNRTNSPELVGKTAIYHGERPAIFAGYLIRVNQCPELDPEYVNYCLNTNYAHEFCQRVKTDGVSQSNINAQKLGHFEVPFCPLPEQQEIARRVKDLFALADRIEGRFREARKRVNSITQAILAKAFRGDLVTTEAELAKAEGRSFESAAELLERIGRNGGLKTKKSRDSDHVSPSNS
jgi:type I restriction enzyme S subunit